MTVVELNVNVTKLEFAYFTANVKLYPVGYLTLENHIIMENELDQFSYSRPTWFWPFDLGQGQTD